MEKPKSRKVLEAFAAGCGGKILPTSVSNLAAGAAAFYGVRPPWKHLWYRAQEESRDWYYLDNAWFDVAREKAFRVGVNALQSVSQQASDGQRLAALGIAVAPWREEGRDIIVCRQSDEYLRLQGEWMGGAIGWQQDVLEVLREVTDRPIKVRIKGADRPLAADLQNAWALVTHSSAAAVEALIHGVPICVTDPDCAAARFATPLEAIEDPVMDDGREDWAARLADSQWTLEELRRGSAWRSIHGQRLGAAA